MEAAVDWFRKGAVLVACLVAFSQAGRVALPEVGASAYVPAGWVLSHPSAREYVWEDTALTGMRGVLGIVATDSVWTSGARSWTLLKAQAHQLDLASDPLSITYIVDSMTQDGRFGMYINSMTVPDTFAFAFQDRYTATDRIGYQLYAWGDTADFYENYSVYTALLDSVQLDGSLAGLGIGAARAKSAAAFALRSRAGGLVEFSSHLLTGAEFVVTDLRGRQVWASTGNGQGKAFWNAHGVARGTYLARVRQEGRILGASSFVLLP